ncbi:MAG: phenylalanine--tRNA ligase subunit beta, partial [Phycisphaerae bacterium]
AATGLSAGAMLVFAPPWASLPGSGTIGRTIVAGHSSDGMIVPAEAIGIEQMAGQAVLLPPTAGLGSQIDVGMLNDWIIEIDNKCITHRPDLWGHYGLAREVAAIYRLPLKPYRQFIVPPEQMDDPSLPPVPITIDQPEKCRRYTGLILEGFCRQPAPLYMQARLSHVGIRPIELTVDLTNYVMAELGQPMHAFDAAKVDRIEVGLAQAGQRFTTLDGLERLLPEGALMIQSGGRNVALAGIMGGADSQVTAETTRVLLESANFDAATIRRCAARLGHRTESSARFEKGLDPNNTVLGIGRFVQLARQELPQLRAVSRLSDCYPNKPAPIQIEVDLDFADRFLGRAVEPQQVRQILQALEFGVSSAGDRTIRVQVPSFRATRDVTMEADVIEEIARFVGYENIEPRLPTVTLRRCEPNALHQLERRTLGLLCGSLGFAEIHSYIWDDAAWLGVLGFEPAPGLTLRNPPAVGMERLRQTLVPALLAAVEGNRHHYERFNLVEVGSVFLPAAPESDAERRRLGLACVIRGGEHAERQVLEQLKSAIECWAQQVLVRAARFVLPASQPRPPWEHPYKSADVLIADRRVGRVTVVPEGLKRRIHEHLRGWSVGLAEIELDPLLSLARPEVRLRPVPAYPQVRLDFSVLAEVGRSFAQIAETLQRFEHPLLRRLSFQGSYQGPPLPSGKTSLTFRACIGDPNRTLTDQDRRDFERSFVRFLAENGLPLRR